MEKIKTHKTHIRSLEKEILEAQRVIEILKKTEVDNDKLIKIILYKERLESKLKGLKDSVDR